MDPNEALHTLLQAADAAQALDGRLSRGGFLPDGWAR
jgi:hypothetical protein